MARSYLSASAAQSPDPGVEIDEDSMRCAHPTFFSGCNRTEVVFPGMHALALAAVFSASVLVEWCDHRLVVAAAAASGLTQTAMHAARVGLGYVLMLAVMSDAAVLAAAVLGHAVGFVAFVHPASRPLTGDTKTRLHPPPFWSPFSSTEAATSAVRRLAGPTAGSGGDTLRSTLPSLSPAALRTCPRLIGPWVGYRTVAAVDRGGNDMMFLQSPRELV
ncbi:hypothetical protein BHM03_00022873 [Ensete ventricosum]|nr:hypothetical protein BHM03_00022873 [Ensete ventricosum]